MIVISNNGEGLPLCYRMIMEGANTTVYLHNKDLGRSYDGIIDKAGISALRSAVDRDDTIFFDLNRVNEHTKRDIALLKAFGCPAYSPSVSGAIADRMIRNGKRVIGSTSWTDSLEFDREFGSHIAKNVGLKTPNYKRFTSIGEAKRFLSSSQDLWVLKPDNNDDLDLTYVEKYPGELLQKFDGDLKGRISGPFILQEKIDGIELSTEGWFDGEEWSAFNHTIESKRMMNSDLGPAIGSQSNTVWMEPDPVIRKSFDKLSPMLKKSGYVGPVDVNAIYKNGEAYFLEWTPRGGYDAIFNLTTLLDSSITDFLSGGFSSAEFRPGFACSERISIPPFPYSEPDLVYKYARDIPLRFDLEDFYALDVYRDGSLKCAGGDGIIGVCSKAANSIGGAFGNVYRAIRDDIRIGSYLQYRTDAVKNHQKRFDSYYEQE
jgi:hypothetical protein